MRSKEVVEFPTLISRLSSLLCIYQSIHGA